MSDVEAGEDHDKTLSTASQPGGSVESGGSPVLNAELLNNQSNNSEVSKIPDKEVCPCYLHVDESVVICCDKCNQWWHTNCVNMNGISTKAVAEIKGWFCPFCYVSKFSPITLLQEELKTRPCSKDNNFKSVLGFDLQRTVSEAVSVAFQSFSSEAKNVIKDTTKSTVEETRKTYAASLKTDLMETIEAGTTVAAVEKVVVKIDQDNLERVKRGCNVVINNVEEEKVPKKAKQADMDFLVKTCEFDKRDIVDCFRAGKPFEREGKTLPRPLVVKLRSKEDVKHYSADGNGFRVLDETVLEAGKAKQYWINQDLCLADRKAQFFVRQERRKRLLAKAREETAPVQQKK